MSSVYQLEPPTEGKVLLTTSHGDIEIELWAKECPKACRNFVQLCLEGYYDGCVWHRIIKDFMIQSGDPSGTGTGGESTYGAPFKDELHSRIKFNHRGQVAMANTGQKDTNGSQFFVTLERCDWIDRKHTIFGKVSGHTIYNAIQIGDVEVEGDRPVDEPFPKIMKTEVLWNPFEDVVPREKQIEKNEENENVKRKKKETKKLNLLSFGDEAEEEEEVVGKFGKAKVKSVFDGVPCDDSKNKGEGKSRMIQPGSKEEAELLRKDEEERLRLRRERMEKQKEEIVEKEKKHTKDSTVDKPLDDTDTGFETKMKRDVASEREKAAKELAALEASAEAKRLRKEVKAEAKVKKENEKQEKESQKLKKLGIGRATVSKHEAELMTAGEQKRVETKRKRANVAGREKDLLAKLAKFQSGLAGGLKASHDAKDGDETEDGTDEKHDPETGRTGVSRFVAQGLYYADDDEDDASDWKSHKLTFKDDKRKDPSAHFASTDDYVVSDPLLEKGKGKYAKGDTDKKRDNEWAGGSLT